MEGGAQRNRSSKRRPENLNRNTFDKCQRGQSKFRPLLYNRDDLDMEPFLKLALTTIEVRQ